MPVPPNLALSSCSVPRSLAAPGRGGREQSSGGEGLAAETPRGHGGCDSISGPRSAFGSGRTIVVFIVRTTSNCISTDLAQQTTMATADGTLSMGKAAWSSLARVCPCVPVCAHVCTCVHVCVCTCV